MEEGKGVNLLDLGKGVAKGAELEKVWVVGRLSLRGCLLRTWEWNITEQCCFSDQPPTRTKSMMRLCLTVFSVLACIIVCLFAVGDCSHLNILLLISLFQSYILLTRHNVFLAPKNGRRAECITVCISCRSTEFISYYWDLPI